MGDLADAIDCVLGIDLLGHILLPGLKQGPLNSPTALLTTLGWIIFGVSSSTDSENSFSVHHVEEKDTLHHQLRLFWEIEELPTKTFLSKEDIECENHFRDTHYRDTSGQYVVRLPLLQPPDLLGRSKESVISMFKRNESQLQKDPIAKAKYNSFIEEYLSLDHMEPVSEEDRAYPKSNYLPHHVISKAHDPTAKIRVVFNSSFRTSSGVSFNEILHPG
ncbi:uncharacterized protein LOC127290817 [Leptopilina boulardi]|uniref:uncharacterized protein LOC127290817 n=1 Tax=Leptopilina boulardi TaxID=63433 RepID=UPI0021F63865|nr:uncharacterized protein LOC127290817 [Leptopilina boulardi]